MRPRFAAGTILAVATFGIMGASTGPESPGPARSVLSTLPLFARVHAEPAALEAAAFQALGVPRRWDAARLVDRVRAWLAGEGLSACGHREPHELAGTRCSAAPGGALDVAYQEVLEAWYQAGLIDAGVVALLYRGLPPFLAATHRLEGERLETTLLSMGPDQLAGERHRLVELGLSAAEQWSPEAVARSLRARLARAEDLGALGARLNPERRDLRRCLIEGLVRPMALVQGSLGPGGPPLRAFLDEFGHLDDAPPALLVAAPPTVEVPAPSPPAPVLPSVVVPAAEPVAAPPAAPPALAEVPGSPRTEIRDQPEVGARVDGPGFAVTFGGTRFMGSHAGDR